MKQMSILVVLLVLFAGCSSFTKSNSQTNEIPSQIGGPNSMMNIPDQHEWTTEEINKKTGYEPYTKKFFKGIYLTTTFHRVNPGENVGTNESFPDQKIRVQLIERNRDLEMIEIVKEKIFTNGEKLSVQLPEETDVLYTYSQEALGENNEVLDTDVSLFYVPPEEFNARMYTENDVLEPDDTMNVKIENWGPTQLTFGAPYTIEKYQNGSWKNVSGNRAFEDIEYLAGPGENFTQEIKLESYNLDNGKYRVVKEFDASNTDIRKLLAVEFEIEY
ncbi:immunoglobulin-like domain-containing protein [Halobacillus mangrovi]|uniref:immunoglobulin-like domain-containing protein n=1 Tax=Halobacillus mangrovi TaxID=402384 RepID=UPI003D976130